MTRFVEDSEAAVLAAVATLADGNPFLPERVASERSALGGSFTGTSAVWHAEADLEGIHPNLPKLRALVEVLAPRLRERLVRGARLTISALLIIISGVSILIGVLY